MMKAKEKNPAIVAMVGLMFFVSAVSVMGQIASPVIDIEKSVNGNDADTAPGPTLQVGETVVWEYVVTNSGNVPLSNIAVTDSVLGTIETGIYLNPGEVWQTSVQGTAQYGQQINIGSAEGTAPDGTVVQDTDPANYYGENGIVPRVPLLPIATIPIALGAGLITRKLRK